MAGWSEREIASSTSFTVLLRVLRGEASCAAATAGGIMRIPDKEVSYGPLGT